MTTIIYYLHKGDDIPFYIGKTTRFKSRKYEHGTLKGDIFMEEIDKVPTNEWVFWEKFYVSLFKCWGFILENKNEGGGGPLTQSLKSKNQISSSMKGKNNWSIGGYHKKKVLQYDLKGNFIKKYSSVEEAKKIYKVEIAGCCRGENKTAAGFIWFYEDNFNNDLLIEKIKKANINGNKNKKKTELHSLKLKTITTKINKNKRKPILQYDLKGNFIQEWEYIRQASDCLNINSSGISNNLAGRYKHAGNYIWKYKNK